jgi:hypothetical protein
MAMSLVQSKTMRKKANEPSFASFGYYEVTERVLPISEPVVTIKTVDHLIKGVGSFL